MVSSLTKRAGVDADVSRVRPGDQTLTDVTGARQPRACRGSRRPLAKRTCYRARPGSSRPARPAADRAGRPAARPALAGTSPDGAAPRT